MLLKTLEYWHKLEHFYPYELKEQCGDNIKMFGIKDLFSFPDFENPSIDASKEKVNRYCVYLGIFRVASALAALEEGIGKKMGFTDCDKAESCFCRFELTSNGVILPESFQISSFPWAVHRVRDGKIDIDHWDDDFGLFQGTMLSRLEEKKTPIDFEFLLGLRNKLASEMNWTVAYCPVWARIDMIKGTKRDKSGDATYPGNATEDDLQDEEVQEDIAIEEQIKNNELLNSFYVRDLERVIASSVNGCEGPLRKFLIPETQGRIDIEMDEDALFRLLSPANLPMGRWPSDYGARLMQQVNVNAFLTRDPALSQSFFSVNGPPGTGKTTLLKDIIAAVVTERADLLSGLSEPNKAFEDTKIGSIRVNAFDNRLWKLRPEFSNFGILVASNNNSAVKNITHELPALSELPECYRGQEYHCFSKVSDRHLGEGKTWAMNAAHLGNRGNCRKFADAFWPLSKDTEPYNFRMDIHNLNADWEMAKRDFREKRAAVEREFSQIKEVYQHTAEFRKLNVELNELVAKIVELEDSICMTSQKLEIAEQALRQSQDEELAISSQISRIQKRKPFLKVKLLLRFMLWKNNPIAKQHQSLSTQWEMLVCKIIPDCQREVLQRRSELEQDQNELENKKIQREEKRRKIEMLTEALEKFKCETGMSIRIDAYFANCGKGECSKHSPWGYERLNKLREQLFLSALKLHEAFVIKSSRMKDNLDGFSKMLRGKATVAQAKEFFSPLFQSFFLFVPVVSTTFASVGTFLRHVPANEIAYLLIDEAGQAVPQSAVGAIWRARKVIAVGDPLQIEPVVTLHESIVCALGEHFSQESLLMDKYTSVQTLADRINRLGGRRTLSEPDDLWVGSPLIVHNRCQYTVFQIANRIAYNDKMIFDTKVRPDAVCRWISVSGTAEDGHYVPAQAEVAEEIVVDAFDTYWAESNKEGCPSLFIITPFRSVMAGIKAYFRRRLPTLLREKDIQIAPKYVNEWIANCIGTIHTFQGKEAGTVILCLGVSSDGRRRGAVDWAGEYPNILNVAVTRSKRKLYIIGDKTVWCRKNYFKTAYDFCNETSDVLPDSDC